MNWKVIQPFLICNVIRCDEAYVSFYVLLRLYYSRGSGWCILSVRSSRI